MHTGQPVQVFGGRHIGFIERFEDRLIFVYFPTITTRYGKGPVMPYRAIQLQKAKD